jgi:hypothetical protein
MFLSALATLTSGISTTISNAINDWSKLNTISSENKAKVELLKLETELKVLQIEAQARTAEVETKLEMARQGQNIDFQHDSEALRQMRNSWKDEFLLLLFSTPLILSFIPSLQPYVLKGWEMIAMAPDWYLWLYGAMIVSVWGLRGIARSLFESKFLNKK